MIITLRNVCYNTKWFWATSRYRSVQTVYVSWTTVCRFSTTIWRTNLHKSPKMLTQCFCLNHYCQIAFCQNSIRSACVVDNCSFIVKLLYEPRYEKTGFLHMRKQKAQISYAVTAQLISAFVFATWIEQSLYFRNPKFRASSHLQWLHSLVRVRPGWNPYCWFSDVAAYLQFYCKTIETTETCNWWCISSISGIELT